MFGRPEKSEAAPYYFTYIDQVTGDNPLAVMEKQLPECLKFFAGITEKSSLHRYAPDKWSIRELLNHVTDTERAFTFRALWFARGFESPLPGYDQNIAAKGAEADRISWLITLKNFVSSACPRFACSRICLQPHGLAMASPTANLSPYALSHSSSLAT
jgi:hypothetical protein